MANNPSQWKKHSAIVALIVENEKLRRRDSGTPRILADTEELRNTLCNTL